MTKTHCFCFNDNNVALLALLTAEIAKTFVIKSRANRQRKKHLGSFFFCKYNSLIKPSDWFIFTLVPHETKKDKNKHRCFNTAFNCLFYKKSGWLFKFLFCKSVSQIVAAWSHLLEKQFYIYNFWALIYNGYCIIVNVSDDALFFANFSH